MTYSTLNVKKSIIGKTNLQVLQALLNKLHYVNGPWVLAIQAKSNLLLLFREYVIESLN